MTESSIDATKKESNQDNDSNDIATLQFSPKYGEMLCVKRESLKLSIEDVSKSLRIRSTYLEAFEKCNISDYPPDVYAKGFLRSYTKLLNLDANEIIRLYQNHSNQLSNIEDSSRHKQLKKLSRSEIAVGFALLLLVVIVVYWGWKIYSSVSQTNVNDSEEVSQEITEPIKLIAPKKEYASDAPKTIPINSEPEDENLTFAQNTDRLLKSLPKGSIIIAAIEDTWLEIRDPKNVIVLAKILGKGQTYIVPRKGTFFLTSGDAGRTVIHYEPGGWDTLGKKGLVFRNFPLKRETLISYFSTR